MGTIKALHEFNELFVLENSSQVYGIADGALHYAKGIVWKFDSCTVYGPAWVTTLRYSTGAMFRNRVIKIRNIKLIDKSG